NENTMLAPRNVLIATGSSPKSIAGLANDGKFVLHSAEALEQTELPDSILIIGGGVIGLEWASLLQDLGVQVTVVESAESILIHEDDDIRKEVQASLEKRGVRFLTKASVIPTSLKKDDTGATITIPHKET